MPKDIINNFKDAQKILSDFLADKDQINAILEAGNAMIDTLNSDGKLISCGNGGSMSDAMHFAEELSGRFRENRPSLAAISISDPSHITCVGNDYGFDYIFSRFIEGVGKPGDVVLGISTSGQSKNIIEAAKTCKANGILFVGLTGKDGGALKDHCDIEIRVPWTGYADRIQEMHIKVIHSLIQYIEKGL